MTRVEALLQLYRLALQDPPDLHKLRMSEWLRSRQRLIDLLGGPGSPTETIERALLALILHADAETHGRWVRCRQQVRARMGRLMRAYGPQRHRWL